MPNGREYTDEEALDLALAVCADISAGMSCVKACRKKGRPARSTFMLWVKTNHMGIQPLYEAALKDRAHTFAEEMIEIADGVKGGTADQIRAADLRISTRKWNAARMEPTVYGERVRQEHTGANGAPIQTESIVNVEAGEAYLRMINGGHGNA
ncbi:MAG: hypothetical protein ACN6PJ_28430 [Achromobacter sp.]|uniref:terminase small subunit-like protein n=1 Tax=Achromobacter sp. TaxID=134375 RepID=UPI003D00C230